MILDAAFDFVSRAAQYFLDRVKVWWLIASLAISRSFEEILAAEDGTGHLAKANEHIYKPEQHTRSPSMAYQEYLILSVESDGFGKRFFC